MLSWNGCSVVLYLHACMSVCLGVYQAITLSCTPYPGRNLKPGSYTCCIVMRIEFCTLARLDINLPYMGSQHAVAWHWPYQHTSHVEDVSKAQECMSMHCRMHSL